MTTGSQPHGARWPRFNCVQMIETMSGDPTRETADYTPMSKCDRAERHRAMTIYVPVFRAQVLAVPRVLAHLGDAVRRGRQRRLAARCREQVHRQHLGAVCCLLYCQLHGQPGCVHDRQGGLRQDQRHQRLPGALCYMHLYSASTVAYRCLNLSGPCRRRKSGDPHGPAAQLPYPSICPLCALVVTYHVRDNKLSYSRDSAGWRGQYAVLGHLRSLIWVPIESLYATY